MTELDELAVETALIIREFVAGWGGVPDGLLRLVREALEKARYEGSRKEFHELMAPMECGHSFAAYVDEWQACAWCKEVEEARAEGAAAERERLKPIMLAIGAGSLVGGIGSQTEATIAAWEGLARAFDKRKVERHGWAAHFRRIAAAIRASAEEGE